MPAELENRELSSSSNQIYLCAALKISCLNYPWASRSHRAVMPRNSRTHSHIS